MMNEMMMQDATLGGPKELDVIENVAYQQDIYDDTEDGILAGQSLK